MTWCLCFQLQLETEIILEHWLCRGEEYNSFNVHIIPYIISFQEVGQRYFSADLIVTLPVPFDTYTRNFVSEPFKVSSHHSSLLSKISNPQNSSSFTIYFYHKRKYRFMDLLLESSFEPPLMSTAALCAWQASYFVTFCFVWCFLVRFKVMSMILVTGEPLKCRVHGSMTS